MAFAPNEIINTNTIIGCFRHKKTNVLFEYSKEEHNEWATSHGATHSIYVNDIFCSTRAAIVKKTVVYVLVDEDEYGNPVWEKWPIKAHNVYNNKINR